MSSGTSYGSSRGTRSSRSEEDDLDFQAQMEKRRKRRKESNRESARRSRVRKQQHLDDLSSQLKNQNQQLSTALGMNTQNLVAVQAQNSVLQTQKMELENRLCALSEIICCMNSVTNTTNPATMGITASSTAYDIFGTSAWSQPIDLFQCF